MPGHHVLLEDFCEHLARQGFQITLLLPEGDAPERERIFRIREYAILSHRVGYPIPIGLLKILVDEHFDLVVTGEDFVVPSWICALNAFLNRVPLVMIQEKYFVSRKALMAPLHRLMLKSVCRFVWRASGRIIAHSRAAAGFLVRNGAPHEKVDYLPLGVDVEKFSPPKARSRSDSIKLLSVARLTDHKGLEYLLEAVHILSERGVRIALRVVGDGPLRSVLETMTREMSIGDLVTITTHVDHSRMKEVYGSADIFVLPSVVEVFGVSVLEAMACGMPVIVTNIGGLSDLPQAEENGFIVEPRDPHALAEAIEKLKDDDMIERMGRRSREIALERFDWAKLAEEYGSVFRDISH